MKSLTFSSGDVIFRQGSFNLTMYDIQEGRVGVYTDYGTAREKEIAVLGAGELLGEMGMIEAVPRSATAVSLEGKTLLYEITEDELSFYLRNRPEQLLRIMKQLSARIRETDGKYYNACKTLHESEQAAKSGSAKNAELNRQLESIREDAEQYSYYGASLRSSFYRYVLDDIEQYGSKATVVRASLLERLLVRNVDPDRMHANPEDEFSKPSVGPNDRIINKYVQMIPQLLKFDEAVFPEAVIVQKIRPDGYMILNGHHRWAAALKTGLPKLRVTITNPRR